jgi:predicted acetyltransferase
MLPGSNGRYELKFLPDFFNDPDRRGYLIRSGDQPVGFALVRGLLEPPFMMSEFFIIRPMRRVGAGSIAADLVITAHPGAWEIPFQMENIGAAPFWRRVAQSRAPNNWSEERRPVPDKPGIPPDVWISFTCK